MGQNPPLPLPVMLSAPVDTTKLRAILQIAFAQPVRHVNIMYDGWHEIGDRPAEASARIAELRRRLRGDPTDAELYDEMRCWYALVDDRRAADDCATKARDFYLRRLQLRPTDPDLLCRLGNLPLDWNELIDAHRRLVEAVRIDSHHWRAWLAMSQVHLLLAEQHLAAYQENMPSSPVAQPLTDPRNMPEILRVGFPASRQPPARQEKAMRPAGDAAPRTAQWGEIRQDFGKASTALEKAFAIAPSEPAVRLRRVEQRVFWTEAVAAAGCDKEAIGKATEGFEAENLLDLRAALAARPEDVDIIAIANGFEIEAAKRRVDKANPESANAETNRLLKQAAGRLDRIAAKADARTAARASVAAAWMYVQLGQEDQASVHAHFAIVADPDNPRTWEVYLALLVDDAPTSRYLSVARRCAARFDESEFQIRLADALARSGDVYEGLRVVRQLRLRKPEEFHAKLTEAVLLLKIGDGREMRHVIQLLDETSAEARETSDEGLQTLCELLRACAQIVGGNATLGRVLLDDLAVRYPDDSRITAVSASIGK
jgi:hypothetical protein